jgi:hypothetical protein
VAEIKACADCKQEFQVDERGCLIIPFIPPTTCERCGKPVHIEYHDGWVSYGCGGHFGAASVLWRGSPPDYCPACHEARRNARSVPCCVCQQKKGFALNTYQGYHLWGGGTAIRLHCNGTACEQAFMALPISQQAFYIRSRCNLAFPQGQVIYKLVDPETRDIRYIGRTHTPSKRLNKHMRDRSDVPFLVGPEEKPYYTRANWVHDLHCKGLVPAMEIVKHIEVAPTVIEWETRYILHGLQQGWPLVNIESANDDKVAEAKVCTLDFLNDSFDALVQAGFFHSDGIEAFVYAYYR